MQHWSFNLRLLFLHELTNYYKTIKLEVFYFHSPYFYPVNRSVYVDNFEEVLEEIWIQWEPLRTPYGLVHMIATERGKEAERRATPSSERTPLQNRKFNLTRHPVAAVHPVCSLIARVSRDERAVLRENARDTSNREHWERCTSEMARREFAVGASGPRNSNRY